MDAVAAPPALAVRVETLGRTDYGATLARMRDFTARRDEATQDAIWLTEHPPVYTLGLAGKREHLLATGDIPVVETDRGGQVTWHGPGQVVAYVLVDLARRGMKVRETVHLIESAIIATLAGYRVTGERRAGMPGVYVGAAKIAALGLKVSHGCTYHGMSLNVDCDLVPFDGINPCGYAGLAATSMAALGVTAPAAAVAERLAAHLAHLIEQHPAVHP
jgi:lipoyl(octanoyl) transferase